MPDPSDPQPWLTPTTPAGTVLREGTDVYGHAYVVIELYCSSCHNYRPVKVVLGESRRLCLTCGE